MYSSHQYSQQWFHNIRGDLLSGLVVALALIPEAIAFSIIAGVDPKIGLYASFSIAVVTAIAGGRPGMISAATAATAVLMVTLVRDYGLQYLLATTVLAGLLQIGAGIANLGYVMRFVSKSVMTGFVNALAILIFLAQLPELDPQKVPTPDLSFGCLGFGYHLLVSLTYPVHSLTFNYNHCFDHFMFGTGFGCPNCWGYGGPSRQLAGIFDPRDTSYARNTHHYFPLCGGRRCGGTSREFDDATNR